MIAFSDHLLMIRFKEMGILKERSQRSLNIIIPTRPKHLIEKKVSIYDLTPTFLDLLDIEYSPKFIFGESLLSNKVGSGISLKWIQYSHFFKSNH